MGAGGEGRSGAARKYHLPPMKNERPGLLLHHNPLLGWCVNVLMFPHSSPDSLSKVTIRGATTAQLVRLQNARNRQAASKGGHPPHHGSPGLQRRARAVPFLKVPYPFFLILAAKMRNSLHP